MKIKLYVSHIRGRHGDDGTGIHISHKDAVESVHGYYCDEFGDDENEEIQNLIDAAKLGEAENLIGEYGDACGHEFSIEEHVVDVAKAEKVT